MSIPWCISLTMLMGAPSMKMMGDFTNPEVLALVERTDLVADPSLNILSCRITLTLQNGERVTRDCVMTSADYAFSFEEMITRLTATCAQEGVAEGAIGMISGFCADPGIKPFSLVTDAFARARA